MRIVLTLYNRSTVSRTVESIHKSNPGTKVTIVDNHSSEPDTITAISELKKNRDVLVIQPETKMDFNKSLLLNIAVDRTEEELILLSDADIIWSANALRDLTDNIAPNEVRYISHVVEIDANNQSNFINDIFLSHAPRPKVIIRRRLLSRKNRPGFGIQAFNKRIFETLGGYDSGFVGWGWEDVDFLLRAFALGSTVTPRGTVLHITHTDELRTISDRNLRSVQLAKNIKRSLSRLRRGNISLRPNSTISRPLIVEER